MKKIIIVLVAILFTSCEKEKQKFVKYKYNTGDVVYSKIDGNKMIISRRVFFSDEPTYEIYYKSDKGNYSTDFIEEFCLTKNK